MTLEESYAIVDAGTAELESSRKSKDASDGIGGCDYGGNTVPDNLLEDSFKAKDNHQFHVNILKSLKMLLKEEYRIEGKLSDIFEKALNSKYGKEYAALNQALPLLKKAFNIHSCDVAMAANEIVLNDDFKMKWIDVSNLKTIKMEMEERCFPRQDDMT